VTLLFELVHQNESFFPSHFVRWVNYQQKFF